MINTINYQNTLTNMKEALYEQKINVQKPGVININFKGFIDKLLFKDKNADILQKRLRSVILGLSNCGLDSVQTSNADLRVVLDSFLNGGMTTESKAVLPSEF